MLAFIASSNVIKRPFLESGMSKYLTGLISSVFERIGVLSFLSSSFDDLLFRVEVEILNLFSSKNSLSALRFRVCLFLGLAMTSVEKLFSTWRLEDALDTKLMSLSESEPIFGLFSLILIRFLRKAMAKLTEFPVFESMYSSLFKLIMPMSTALFRLMYLFRSVS